MATPLVVLARGLARAFEEWAAAIEADETGALAAPGDEIEQVSALGRGHRQRQVLALEGLYAATGMTTREVAIAIEYDDANVWLVLDALRRRDVVEIVPGSDPQRWRISERHRRTAEPYVAIARLVRAGEWTTYGDVAVAAGMSAHSAIAVGRAAATLPNFPNPHRVLKKGGLIAEDWHDDEGRGADECRRRLKEEGVKFVQDHANPAQRVTWEILRDRAEAVAAE